MTHTRGLTLFYRIHKVDTSNANRVKKGGISSNKGCKVMGSKKWDPSTDPAEGWGNYSWSKNGNAKKIHCHLEYLLNMSRLKKNDQNDQPLSQTFSAHSGRPRWYETSPHITDFVSKSGTKFWQTTGFWDSKFWETHKICPRSGWLYYDVPSNSWRSIQFMCIYIHTYIYNI